MKITRRNVLLGVAGAPLMATKLESKPKVSERPFDFSSKEFTVRHVPVGGMTAINEFMADLWIGRTYPTIFVSSSEVFCSILNGTEPCLRSTYCHAGGDVPTIIWKWWSSLKIDEIINAGYNVQPFISGILCIDKYLRSNEMYLICTKDNSAKHNGILSWDTWEGPKTEMQIVQERLAALEAKIG